MSQQQYQRPAAGPFSPSQISPSLGNPQAFSLPPNKRQRLSPDGLTQSPTPYQHQSPYSASPNTGTPTSTTASPHFSNISLPQLPQDIYSHRTYNTPYANGHTTSGPSTPSISLPNSLPNPAQNHPTNNQQPQSSNGQTNGTPNGLYPNGQFQNTYTNMPPNGAGMMGPPSKPAERENVNDDQMDVLANAGVDLRAEESYAMSFHTGSFNSQPGFSQPSPNATGHAFTQFVPGDASKFYGAGPASQPGQITDKATQDELQKKAADKTWAEAALALARSRQHELDRPHMEVRTVWRRMESIARDNGLVLNTEPGGRMPQFKLPNEFPSSNVTFKTVIGPNGAMMVTGGNFLPADTALADQLALLSLATNQRIRVLLEDAVALARNRRRGTQGVVPAEWADVSAPLDIESGTIVAEGAPRNGWESAVSPRTNPLKRPLSTSNRLLTPVSDGTKTPVGIVQYPNDVVMALKSIAQSDRNLEELRLLKRQARLSTDGTSRQGSIVPGTPGSVAPEPTGKPLTKKEREKQDKGKQSIAESHAQANATTNQFLFGGGKKKKTYSWMTGGGTGSGASTPSRINTQGLPGTPGAPGVGPDKVMLTAEGTNKMGQFREDVKSQAGLVEVRDWLFVLEHDGLHVKSMQNIYASLDKSVIKKA